MRTVKNFAIHYKFKDEYGTWNYEHTWIEAKDESEARKIFKTEHPDVRRFKVICSYIEIFQN